MVKEMILAGHAHLATVVLNLQIVVVLEGMRAVHLFFISEKNPEAL